MDRAVNADHVALVSAVVTKDAADYKLTHRIKEEFADGVTVDLALEASIANKGDLKFAGGATINQPLGTTGKPLGIITFAANDAMKVIKLNADIVASDLILGKATYRPTKTITLTSVNADTTKLKSPTFDLGTEVLKFSGNVVHDDIGGNITINTIYDGTNAGHIAMTKAGDQLNLSNSAGLILNISYANNTALPDKGQTRIVDMFVENGGTLTLNDQYTINNANEFVVWSFNTSNGELSRKLVANPTEVLENVVNNPAQNQNINNLTDQTLTELFNIAANQGGAAASGAIERLTNSDAVAIASAPVNLAIQDATQVVSNRAESITTIAVN
jgi:hypothetical protein